MKPRLATREQVDVEVARLNQSYAHPGPTMYRLGLTIEEWKTPAATFETKWSYVSRRSNFTVVATVEHRNHTDSVLQDVLEICHRFTNVGMELKLGSTRARKVKQ